MQIFGYFLSNKMKFYARIVTFPNISTRLLDKNSHISHFSHVIFFCMAISPLSPVHLFTSSIVPDDIRIFSHFAMTSGSSLILHFCFLFIYSIIYYVYNTERLNL